MIIGISGKARSGKDQFADYLEDAFSKYHDIEFAKVAFADELKTMCMTAFGLDHDQLWGDRKEEETKFQKPGFPQGVAADYWDGRKLPPWYWTAREIMQVLGSFYRSIDYDYWVKQLIKSIKHAGFDNVIITDVRHINECEYIKENGVLIKVVREDVSKIHGMDHESETALDNREKGYFDIEINNNETLDKLYQAAGHAADAIIRLENMRKQGRSYDGEER